MISPAAVEYVLGRLEGEITKRLGDMDADLLAMQQRKQLLEAELENLGRVCADGFNSKTIREGIAKREREIAELVTKVAGRNKCSVRGEVKDLRKFVEHYMGNLRRLLTRKKSSAALVKSELAKHVGSITLLPEGKEIRYRGNWKLLAQGDTGGAEGQS